MRTYVRVYLNYQPSSPRTLNRGGLSRPERATLREEIASVLNVAMPTYTILKKELGEFYFEEPDNE